MVQLIMNAIRDHIATLSSDSNGNHVIQRCLQYMPLESKAEIYEQVIQHCFDVYNERNGIIFRLQLIVMVVVLYNDVWTPLQSLTMIDSWMRLSNIL